VPHDLDLTRDQANAVWYEAELDLADDRTEIINDSGREVLLQTEKVASEPAWNSLKDLVGSRFPLAAPMVDALAEACDEHLQETLREKVPELVQQLADKTADIRSSPTSIGICRAACRWPASCRTRLPASRSTTRATRTPTRRAT